MVSVSPWLLAAIGFAVLRWLLPPAIIGLPLQLGFEFSTLAALAGFAWHSGGGRVGRLMSFALIFSATGLALAPFLGSLAPIILAAAALCAIGVFAGYKRAGLTSADVAIAAVFGLTPPVLTFLLTFDFNTVLNAGVVGALAAIAWTSGFSRALVGFGALLLPLAFVLLLLLPPDRSGAAQFALMIWPLVWLGHALPAIGVVREFH